MTLDEARALVGHKVVYVGWIGDYSGRGVPREEGVITSVNDRYVFVRYGADMHSKATRPEDLITITQPAPPPSDTPACSPDPKT